MWADDEGSGGHYSTVKTTTLDQLDRMYGRFKDAILWLDIEGMELRALQGAIGLLRRKAVRLINVEIRLDSEETVGAAIKELLTSQGFYEVFHWDRQSGNHYDAIYVMA